MTQSTSIAVYPGTFDPITNGHLDILERALHVFQKVIVTIAVNQRKQPLFSTEERIEFIRDAKVIAPNKPWFCYLCPGAGHAPHHVFEEWVAKYAGKFDMGYERYREIVLENQKKLGIVPPDTELSPINPYLDVKGPNGEPWPLVKASATFFFSISFCLGPAFCGARREPVQNGTGGLQILLHPDGVIEGHGLTPVGHRETWISNLGSLEGSSGGWILKVV